MATETMSLLGQEVLPGDVILHDGRKYEIVRLVSEPATKLAYLKVGQRVMYQRIRRESEYLIERTYKSSPLIVHAVSVA